MRSLKFLSLLLGLSLITTVLTSSIPVDVANPEEKKTLVTESTKVEKKGLSKKEIIAAATELKGEKLTFKEKLALKIFNKKISNYSEQSAKSAGNKSQLIALLLVILVGSLGIHRFYLGYTWQGIVQLLTAGGCGIWWLIDLIRIITGDLKPKDGEYASKL
ncbi:MAG TPA: hypothetical protein DIW54_00765 [Chitinophagaceae bacterium]|nr:hypothetical protein [Chitinophagaceae bacterium]HCT21934.1 hypothetical protein [Chitinophagaceae bacterium]